MKEGSFEELRAKMLASAKAGIQEAYSSEEYALIQAINAYLETNKSYNLTYERLTEWFGIYFPEIRVNNAKSLADLALLLTKPEQPSIEEIKKIINNEQMAKIIHEKSGKTIGRKMNLEEKKAVIEFAELSNNLLRVLTSLEDYIKIASERILPNTTYLTDEKIAAELLSKAGSMERLATMPASTVQLLGAEKSLFKHIKFGSKPPKYGVLFKLPVVNTAPREIRGRIARVYATKISIGLKADYYTKKFIGKELKKTLDETVQKIRSAPIKPKPQMQQYQQKPQEQRRGGQHRGPMHGHSNSHFDFNRKRAYKKDGRR
ncbi:MAG: NOP58 family protein [Candidatus Micrarchaeales archaeon]|nr:NOP58 family protein [Candidatus Micrarchaeales archaeon]